MLQTVRTTWRTWAWAGVPVLGALLVLAFVALPTGSTIQSAEYDLTGLAMVAIAAVGVLVHKPTGRLPWLLLIVGQLAFVVGDIIWTAYDAAGDSPFPSLADAAYLAGYPLLALGLAVAIGRRIRGGDRAGLLDGAILATGATVVWWFFVLGPEVAAGDPDPLAFWISIAYPVGDLLLIGLALGLVMTPGARTAAFGLVVANLVILLVGDLTFSLQSLNGTYVDGGILDTLWLVAYTVFGTAALHPTMAGLFDPRPVPVILLGPTRLALLAGAMLTGPALLAIDRGSGGGIVVVVAIATAIVSVLVLTRLAGIVGHLDRDIERRTALEAQLSFQAFHDPLTGLANRRRFVDAVGASLAAGAGTTVLFLDLDDFKHVNDDLGHDAGDALLSAVGHRLVASVRPGDLVCRIGGDEFAVFLPATPDTASAETVAERLLASLGAPVRIEGRDLHISASLGVSVLPAGVSVAVDEVLRRADVAMYQAKAKGKDQFATFTPALDVATGGQPATQPARHERSPRPATAA